MTRRATFQQSDATRALKAVVQAGLQPGLLRILPDGEIRIPIAQPGATAPASGNAWDEVFTL